MILIVSKEYEKTTIHILEQIDYLGLLYQRINREDAVEVKNIIINNNQIDVKIYNMNSKENIDFNNITAFYCRKGNISYKLNTNHLESISENKQKHILKHLQTEWLTIQSFLFQELHRKKCFSDYEKVDMNKLHQLFLAKKCDIDIPNSLVSTQKKSLQKFQNNHQNNVINKSIQNYFDFVINPYHYFNYTEKVEPTHIENLEENFFSSLLQENLQKLYELRIFFINNDLYASAIFSQSHQNTSIDWRKSTEKSKVIRFVPYTLPSEIKTNILKFINLSGLNTGSIDMIVTKNKKYYFLEVNPSGEFLEMSKSCNYFLDKKVVEFLKSDVL
ncbi:MAG: grasp-with-spasm system ATP-grasp peptide maturase [Cytophagia bacterium]|nr:MAG: grasp-with-spasm system ATP-grasp peptide maturase [Cytophagales bacterium]TAG03978.1 MAG: grasp-with-spasm system ATP-grasp peptide maturase [Cytophagia bacterium]TAG42662.1 MAG: grasp-with-spasm system ATP-grasp peptide maturase [Cytophagia bacterium]